MTSIVLSCLLTIAATPQEQIQPIPETVLVATNTENRILYHLPGAGHLPASIRFIEVPFDEVKNTSIRPCPVCFPDPTPNVDDYQAELILAYMVEREIRAQFQILQTHPQLDKVILLGNKVLDNWPDDLKGYKYRFSILDADLPNAFAVPTGYVYVTTGLLDLLETDEELESILAHEISHIEKRHGYTQFERAQRVGLLAEIANILLSATLDVDLSLLTTFASILVFQGYSLDNEREADFYAARYLGKMYPSLGSFHYLSPLRKLEELTRDAPRAFLPTHPELLARIQSVANVQSVLTVPLVYSGIVEQRRVTGAEGARLDIAQSPDESAKVELRIIELHISPTNGTAYVEVSLSGWAEFQVVGFRLYCFYTQDDPQKANLFITGLLLETGITDISDSPITDISGFPITLTGEAMPALQRIERWGPEETLQTVVLEIYIRSWESRRSRIRVTLYRVEEPGKGTN